jgi:tellurite resistance protein TehA-like permease
MLGGQFLMLYDNYAVATAFLALGAWFWVSAIYAIFFALIVKEDKPDLEQSINGNWLLATVGTESVALLAIMLSDHFGSAQSTVLFASTSLWLFGGALYGWMMSIIIYRYLFLKMDATDIEPPHWLDMGAMAVAAYCGIELAKHLGSAPNLLVLMPFVQGMTMLFWSVATWWIPMSALLGIWRMRNAGAPRYQTGLWSFVFPLGIYAAATGAYSSLLNEPFLIPLAFGMAGLSLIAWIYVSGMFVVSRLRH